MRYISALLHAKLKKSNKTRRGLRIIPPPSASHQKIPSKKIPKNEYLSRHADGKRCIKLIRPLGSDEKRRAIGESYANSTVPEDGICTTLFTPPDTPTTIIPEWPV
jgi:ribosomal protein S8E